MQLASDPYGQLGCGIWKRVQLEPFCYEFQLLIVQFRVQMLGFVRVRVRVSIR